MFKRKIIIITISYIIGILGGIYFKKYIPPFCICSLIISYILKYKIKSKNNKDYRSSVKFKFINIIVISLIIILISSFFTIKSENNYNKIYKYDNNEFYCVVEIKSCITLE